MQRWNLRASKKAQEFQDINKFDALAKESEDNDKQINMEEKKKNKIKKKSQQKDGWTNFL